MNYGIAAALNTELPSLLPMATICQNGHWTRDTSRLSAGEILPINYTMKIGRGLCRRESVLTPMSLANKACAGTWASSRVSRCPRRRLNTFATKDMVFPTYTEW